MNKFHYYDDPLVLAAKNLLEGKTLADENLDEGVEEIAKKVEGLKVGDKTTFGVVVAIGGDSITFKAKDLPKTKILFNQRKVGSKDFVLARLSKLKEEVELEVPKDIEDYANKIEMYSYASTIYDGMMDVFGGLNLPKADISAMVKRALDDVKKTKKKNEIFELEGDIEITEDTIKRQIVSYFNSTLYTMMKEEYVPKSTYVRKVMVQLIDFNADEYEQLLAAMAANMTSNASEYNNEDQRALSTVLHKAHQTWKNRKGN